MLPKVKVTSLYTLQRASQRKLLHWCCLKLALSTCATHTDRSQKMQHRNFPKQRDAKRRLNSLVDMSKDLRCIIIHIAPTQLLAAQTTQGISILKTKPTQTFICQSTAQTTATTPSRPIHVSLLKGVLYLVVPFSTTAYVCLC